MNSKDIRMIVDQRADAENYRVCLTVLESLKKSYLSKDGEGFIYSVPGVFSSIRMTYSQLHIALHQLIRVRDYSLCDEFMSEEKIKSRTEYWNSQIVLLEGFIAEARQRRQEQANLMTLDLLKK